MKNPKLSINTILLFSIVSILLIVLGHNFVLQRMTDGPTEYLTIRDDALEYVTMIEGNSDSVHSPLKYRILVPFLSSLLPFAPIEAIRIISYLSLFIFYFTCLLICLKLRINKLPSILGLLCAFTTRAHLYNYYNPFLTDAFGLMIISILIYAFLSDTFPLFVFFSVVGLLARETTIFLVPLWFMKNIQKGTFITILSLLIIIVPRFGLITDTNEGSLLFAFNSIGIEKLQSPYYPLINIFNTFGFLWCIIIVGLCFVNQDKIKDIKAIFITLLIGAVITSAIATDTGRMFSVIFPIIVITVAQLISMLLKKDFNLGIIILMILIIIQFFTSMPNIVFNESSFVFSYQLRHVISILGIVYSVSILIIFGKDLKKVFMKFCK